MTGDRVDDAGTPLGGGGVLPNPRGLFLSYRRADSQPWTSRLADDLREYYGNDRVYLDLDSNTPGRDYLQQLDEFLRGSRVVIAVLGPNWLTCADQDGRRRLDDPDDVVRRELEAALASGIAIVVVRVGAARMPVPDELPPSLRPLAFIHALRLADEDWDHDLGRLVASVGRFGVIPGRDSERKSPGRQWRHEVAQPIRYERTVQATRRRALDGVIGAVESLGYKERRVQPDAAQVSFRAAGRPVDVQVVDAAPGRSKIIIHFPSVRTGLLAAGTVALGAVTSGVGLVAWPAVRAWERRFAKGLLDNVEGVLEGRGVGRDSAVLPGVQEWRNRSKEL